MGHHLLPGNKIEMNKIEILVAGLDKRAGAEKSGKRSDNWMAQLENCFAIIKAPYFDICV